MARTVAEVLNSVDGTLNDAGRRRYPAAERRDFVVDALNGLKNQRPDLFLGKYTASIGPLADTDPLPISDQFFRPLVDYVVARCETKDAEHVVSGRVELFAKFFGAFL